MALSIKMNMDLPHHKQNIMMPHRSQPKKEFGPVRICGIGSVLGGIFVNTTELLSIKYTESRSGPDKDKW